MQTYHAYFIFFDSQSYHDLSVQAKERFGVAEIRPQDADPGLMRFLRRTNLELAEPFPERYAESLNEWNISLPPLTVPQLGHFSEDMIYLQDAGRADAEIVGQLRPPPGGFSVLSVNLQVHNDMSFDGIVNIN